MASFRNLRIAAISCFWDCTLHGFNDMMYARAWKSTILRHMRVSLMLNTDGGHVDQISQVIDQIKNNPSKLLVPFQ